MFALRIVTLSAIFTALSLCAQTATPADAVALKLSTNGSPVSYGTPITLNVAVNCAGIANVYGTVQFFYDGKIITGVHLSPSGDAEYTWSNLPGGSHAITTKYLGTDCKPAESSPLTQVVEPAATETKDLTVSPNPSTPGQKVAITATVTAAYAKPTGVMQFFDGAKLITGVAINPPGVATLNTGTLSPGTHSISAKYVGNPNYAPSTSTAVTQEVKQ